MWKVISRKTVLPREANEKKPAFARKKVQFWRGQTRVLKFPKIEAHEKLQVYEEDKKLRLGEKFDFT